MTFIIFYKSNFIIALITGLAVNNEIVSILSILVFGIIFSSFGGLYTQVFVNLKKADILNKISFYIMIINLLFAPIIIHIYGAIGLSFFVLLRQFSVISIASLFIKKIKIQLIKGKS